ncbi:MAG TPA: hypothetical protein VFL63_09060 [Rhodanobacteraceae bacterium]|nr:hypothetical protein [Rhodanobacteraceae bacterium]
MNSLFTLPYYFFCIAVCAFMALFAWALMGWWAVAALVAIIIAGVAGFVRSARPADGVERIGREWSDKDWLKRMRNE